jgi:hypothetical protein
MTPPSILYGLDRLPSTIATDDPRLPTVNLDAGPLRLNSLPLAVDAWNAGGANHAARMATVGSWLLASCGDYNEALRRGVVRYLDAVAAHVTHHRDVLAAGLTQFHGLYQAEDWCWSALRPLPRAWWRQDGAWSRADVAFWNGDAVIGMRARDFETGDLPIPFQHFWNSEVLPVSPFRRPIPGGISFRPSSP